MFEITAIERSIGEPIEHKDRVVLLDDTDQRPSKALFCNTSIRKRQRTCHVKSCSGLGTESCTDPRHSFTVYKLPSDDTGAYV